MPQPHQPGSPPRGSRRAVATMLVVMLLAGILTTLIVSRIDSEPTPMPTRTRPAPPTQEQQDQPAVD